MADTEDAEIILSQPGMGPSLGPRVLGEFGDDPKRYATAKARKNYAATVLSPAPPARRRWSQLGSCTTTGSSMR
ncbi:hypothetical protein [Rhodococcus sp. USK13]|uniref:hypothetical protein n=1 Tax=Rhodococcus sp. USK13 TaxID=2806442 RepID=UPI001BCBAB11|nr:hypothetical protein [Rhodococcus sp. USK13]